MSLKKPLLLYRTIDNLGDNLLVSALAYECNVYQSRCVAVQTNIPEIFFNNPTIRIIFYCTGRQIKILKLEAKQKTFNYQFVINSWRIPKVLLSLGFFERKVHARCHPEPKRSLMEQLAQSAGFQNLTCTRPWYYPYNIELEKTASIAKGAIIMQSAGKTSFTPNKEWFPERFSKVANVLSKNFKIIQVGLKNSPSLPNAIDLRGKTNLRELGAILGLAKLFIGQEGALMHFARAVDLPSVIVYGGFSEPKKTGYEGFENIAKPVPCSPCYLIEPSPYNRKCMEIIQPEDVVEAAYRLINRPIQKRHWES